MSIRPYPVPPVHRPPRAQGDPSHPRVRPLLSLERQLFSCWFRWLTSSANEGAQRLNFISLMDSVDDELRQAGGPFFLGPELSMVDCMFAPFLERMAASLPYYKGLPVRRQAQVCFRGMDEGNR